jgi:LmbE family N-acetylglucosaminyl deacetylase
MMGPGSSPERKPASAGDELCQLLDELGVSSAPARVARPWLVIAPHPDDETIGASWVLGRHPTVNVVYATDGAPFDPALWSPLAGPTREDYVALRAAEARRALALAGVASARVHALGCADQELTEALVGITLRLQSLIEALRPAVVIAPPYEGGHPDHDAAAFAARAALDRARSEPMPERPALEMCGRAVLVEMTSYHRRAGALAVGEFLRRDAAAGSGPETRQAVRRLSERDRALKARMLACYRSQAAVVAAFGVGAERYRPAPRYDFGAPPHAGPLHYETLGWRLSGERWRRLVHAAGDQLGVPIGRAGAPGC